MNTRPQPECPECEKLSQVSDESNKIGQFLDWMLYTKSYRIELYNDDNEIVSEIGTTYQINKILAEFFEIDLDKVEKERMELLKWLQEQNS